MFYIRQYFISISSTDIGYFSVIWAAVTTIFLYITVYLCWCSFVFIFIKFHLMLSLYNIEGHLFVIVETLNVINLILSPLHLNSPLIKMGAKPFIIISRIVCFTRKDDCRCKYIFTFSEAIKVVNGLQMSFITLTLNNAIFKGIIAWLWCLSIVCSHPYVCITCGNDIFSLWMYGAIITSQSGYFCPLMHF